MAFAPQSPFSEKAGARNPYILMFREVLSMNGIQSKLLMLVKVTGEVLFLFGLLAWVDGVIIQFTHPEWLSWPVTHLLLWVRTDTFTIFSFIVSAIGLFMWRLVAELTKSTEAKKPQP